MRRGLCRPRRMKACVIDIMVAVLLSSEKVIS